MKKKKTIAEIKDLKVKIGLTDLFNKEKIKIKKVVISDANFSLLRDDLKLLNKIISKKFSNKKIKINNRNIFLKDNLEDISFHFMGIAPWYLIQMRKLSNFFNA